MLVFERALGFASANGFISFSLRNVSIGERAKVENDIGERLFAKSDEDKEILPNNSLKPDSPPSKSHLQAATSSASGSVVNLSNGATNVTINFNDFTRNKIYFNLDLYVQPMVQNLCDI